jgi:hypothetical protein
MRRIDFRKFFLMGMFAISIIWIVISYSNNFGGLVSELAKSAALFGLFIAVCDVILAVSLVLACLTVGTSAIRVFGKKPAQWLKADNFKILAREVGSNGLFLVCFFVGWLAAVVAGLLIIIGTVTQLPVELWPGLLTFAMFDLLATNAVRVPILAAIKSKSSDNLVVRQATFEDVDAYLRIVETEWPQEMWVSREKVMSRLRLNPTGVFAAEYNGSLVGMLTTIRLSDYSYSDLKSWSQTTDDGWCTNHDPSGMITFGVDLTVSRKAPRGTVDALEAAAAMLVVKLGLKYMYWGARIPGYSRYLKSHPGTDVCDYVKLKRSNGKYRDPEIQIYSKTPWLEIVGVIPNYIDDPESLNNGLLLRCKNPVYRWPVKGLWLSVFKIMWRLEQRRSQKAIRKSIRSVPSVQSVS